jgi:hypothetical protein
MASYFLKTPDGKRMYRVEYAEWDGHFSVGSVHVTGGEGETLPDGGSAYGVDLPIMANQLIVELVLATVVPATIEEYRTLAESVLATSWAS